MAEYVCGDGRMSINGICPASSYPGYQKPAENIVTPLVTNNNQNVGGDGKDYSKDVKSTFEWDFDKVGNKVANFGSTVKSNITAYDDYVENEFGISKNVSKGFRAVGVGMGVGAYGAVGALVPFAIPFMAGGALNNKQEKENERITNITNQDTQGDISTVDMATYGMPTYGEVGFNIHNDAGDKGNSGGTSDGNSPGNSGVGGGMGTGYCFDPSTPIQMADGSNKKIKDIQLGDNTKGGEVTGVFQFKAADEIHDYKGVTVAGGHYVKEDDKFIMVKDSPLSIKIDKIPVVYSLDTSDRRIFINDIEFADYNGDGVAKNFLSNAGVDLNGFDNEVLRQVENRLI